MSRDTDLLERISNRIVSIKGRLALPLQALSEIVVADSEEGVTRRDGHIITLAESLGNRFFVTQDIGDLFRLERRKSISSIPRTPPDFLMGLLDASNRRIDFYGIFLRLGAT
jgi:hypothetical protein